MGSGGERGIRTLVRLSPKHAFQACAIDHSATSPYLARRGQAPTVSADDRMPPHRTRAAPERRSQTPRRGRRAIYSGHRAGQALIRRIVRQRAAARWDGKFIADRRRLTGSCAHAGPVATAQPRYLFKASDLAFEMLVDTGAAIPAPYLARAKWVQMTTADSLSDEDLTAYLAQSHALVAAKLTRKLRAELGLRADRSRSNRL